MFIFVCYYKPKKKYILEKVDGPQEHRGEILFTNHITISTPFSTCLLLLDSFRVIP